MTLKIGTSGYSFQDWKGPVYPDTIKNTGMFAYYQDVLKFDTVEINYTYYRIPSAKTMEGLAARSDDGFDFAVKYSKEMTHEIFDKDWNVVDNPDAFRQFMEGVRPLAEAEKLGCLLAQFPYSFIKKQATIDHLLRCKERAGNIPFVAEFRHKSWVTPNTFASLKRHGIGFCIVDEPPLPRLMPLVPEVTSDTAYFRFHGRNTAWFTASRDERYNYLYSKKELNGFAKHIHKVRSKAQTTYIFFNNCHHGKAAVNAKQMKEMLQESMDF